MSRRSAVAQRGRTLRCAIYTRKSSEEGLEQDFNSLHAQREACEAFIKSQRHEGWLALPEHYDDGGLSGGTIERPALQQLLAAIKAGWIDVVVVYKVDRLTRSLSDFAKIVEIFDEKEVSFVSVTQQFNTTSSMGRLTLNVLLSFAQFEREVTGERIRDKIAASKRKGMWMGGTPPLGYAVKDRKLVVIEHEAACVRTIFARYAALGSVRLLKQELDACGIVSKSYVSAGGRQHGGRPFARGALYLLLQNRIYIGEIVHKDEHYPGQHEPIVDRQLWDSVQARLAGNAVERRSGAGAKEPSLLAGLFFDSEGNRMTPTHAVKRGKRYRYYVSNPLIAKGPEAAPGGFRVPAADIEQLVGNRLRSFLADPSAVFTAIHSEPGDPGDQKRLVDAASAMARTWAELLPARKRHIVCQLIGRIDVHLERVEIHVLPARLRPLLTSDRANPSSAWESTEDEPRITLAVPAKLKRAGMELRMIIDGPDPYATLAPDPSLIRLLVKAHKLRDVLLAAGDTTVTTLAEREGISGSYFARLIRLSFLAPDLTKAILEGRQPPTLTARTLMRDWDLPTDWAAQRQMLGFT